MPKALAATLTLMLAVILSAPGIAHAHVLKQNNGMSAELHIPPEDQPQAGQPTELDISFSNAANTFSLANCTCSLAITEKGQTILTTKLQPYVSQAVFNAKTVVRFPGADNYTVIVSGSPKTAGLGFSAFRIEYPVKVAANPTQPAAAHHTAVLAVIGSALLIILVSLGYQVVRRA
jgi:hypothetical protein